MLLSYLLIKILLTARLCSFASCSEGSWYSTLCRRTACAMTKKCQEIKASTHPPEQRSGLKPKEIFNWLITLKGMIWFASLASFLIRKREIEKLLYASQFPPSSRTPGLCSFQKNPAQFGHCSGPFQARRGRCVQSFKHKIRPRSPWRATDRSHSPCTPPSSISKMETNPVGLFWRGFSPELLFS